MTPERLEKIQALFEQAQTLRADERQPFLAAACGTDDTMRLEVERMIASTSASGDFLENSLLRVADALASSVQAASLQPGEVLCHRFEIQSFLGAGGMGEVYSAYDRELRELIAIKTIRANLAANTDHIEMLRREVRQARHVVHANVCHVYEMFTHSSDTRKIHFLTMQLLRGCTLDKYIVDHGRLTPEQAFPVLEQIASGIHAAHTAGVIHRDLKCANVFITEELPNAVRVVVADFGTAIETRDDTGEVTASLDRLPMGTLNYMAPEQLEGDAATVRSDVYALGLIAYEILTGQLPYEEDPPLSAALKRAKSAPPAPSTIASDVPPYWDSAITRCLSPDPASRFGQVTEFIEALQRKGPETTLIERQVKVSRRRLTLALVLFLVAVAAAALAFVRSRSAPDANLLHFRSIAVLPFRNATGDPNTEYLADGITEEIIHSLGGLRGIRVVGRNSAFRYKRDDIDIPSVAHTLDVDLIMTGRIQRIGQRLSIRTFLIDAANRQLWTQNYDREMSDISGLQAEVASALSKLLHAEFTPERQEAMKRHARNTEAYDLYLKARFEASRRDRSGLENAVRLLKRATERDPDYAIAYAELGNCYLLLADYGFVSPADILSPARAALMRAIQLDSGLSESHAVLGQLYALFDWDWPNAERAYQRAIELNSNNSSAYHWYAQLLHRLGRINDALALAQESLRLDPVSVPTHTFLGWIYFYGRQYERALAQAEEALQLNPYFMHAHLLRSQAAAHSGNAEVADSEMRMAAQLANDDILASRYTGTILAIMGKRRDARAHLTSLQRSGPARQSAFTGYLCAYLGLRDETFKWLEKAYSERDPALTLIRVHPALDKFRQDPRYTSLIQRMRMPSD